VLHLHCRCLSLKIAETQKARDESHSSGKGDMTASAEIANMIGILEGLAVGLYLLICISRFC